MPTIFTLFVILISSDGIFGLSRKARTTQGDPTGHLTTDRNAVAEYISQKIKGIEQATELSGNPNFRPGSAPNLGPGIQFGAPPPHAKQQKETNNLTPGQYINEGVNPAILAPNSAIIASNQKNVKEEPATKRLHHNLKSSSDDHARLVESSSGKPDGYAMRISAETFEIDATIDASNNTEGAGHGNWSNLSEPESENSYSDLGEVPEAEKNKETTVAPGLEDDNVSGEVTTMDPVDEEIKHVLEALPKLPELAFSDNNTQFTFHKDPEEAALDDRITQVARQLAETSLRREYEEKKLGHYIPIRLRHFDDDYPSNAFSPAKKLSTDKAYSNALDILRQIQQPQIRFRALSIPQHIYSGPLYRPEDESLQSPTKVQLSNSPGPVYVTETDENTRMAVAPLFNPNGFGAIVQLGPRYVLPVPKASIDQNRIPLFFGLTQPKPVQPFHNRNDLNTYPYREIA